MRVVYEVGVFGGFEIIISFSCVSGRSLALKKKRREKSETELTASVLEKDRKHTKGLVKTGQGANFRGDPLFQATDKTKQITYLLPGKFFQHECG